MSRPSDPVPGRGPVRRSPAAVALVLFSLLPCACAQVRPRAEFERAREALRASTGGTETFDPSAPSLTPEAVAAVLADGLSLEEALRLTLVNNRDLQAGFQEIGVAHADWVQSGFLSNPSLDLLLRFPSGAGRTGVEGTLVADLLQFWRLPLREQAARHDLDATVLRIARTAAERLASTRGAYFGVLTADELVRRAADDSDLAVRLFRSVGDLRDSGAADDLDLSIAAGPVADARIAAESARLDAAEARRDLARELSIESDVGSLLLTDRLPDPPPEMPDADATVAAALAGRLDLRAMAQGIEAASVRVELERRAAWGDVAGGVTAERPAGDGATVAGPVLSLTLPVFDQNQAGVARAEAERSRLQRTYEATRVAVAQDVRSAIDRLRAAVTTLALHRAEVEPPAERALALAAASYAEGRATLSVLIDVQRRRLDARRAEARLRAAVALAAVAVETAAGVPLRRREASR